MTGRPWLLLAIVLALCAPPLLVHVGAPHPVRIMESLSFLTSQETWLRQHAGESDAWRLPSWNGAPRLQKPPLLVWMNLLAWADLSPDTADVDRLTLRARYMALALALLAVASAFWAGWTLADRRGAILAGLATGSMMLFMRQSRVASYDTHLVGWVTLSVAAGLWAMTAQSSSRPALRALVGWLIAWAALTAAAWTKGPLAFPLVLAPLLAALIALPGKRADRGIGLAALAVAAGVAMIPWFRIAATADNATIALDREYRYIFESLHNPVFYLNIVPLSFPWTLWLLAALVFAAGRTARRDRPLFFAWLWVVILLALLTLSPMKNKRYLVPALPAAGVLLALAWLRFERLARGPTPPRWLDRVRRLHWIVLAAASIGIPLFVVLQPVLIRARMMRHPDVAGLGWPSSLLTALALGIVTFLGARSHARLQWGRAGVLTALWMLIAGTFWFSGYARAPHQRFAPRADAEAVARLTGHTNLVFISEFQFPQHQAKPSDEFLIFYRGIVPRLSLEDIRARAEADESFFVLTRISPDREQLLEKTGLRRLSPVNDGRSPDWKLFQAGPP